MQHAQLLACVQEPVFVDNQDNDVQFELDQFYDNMLQLLDTHYQKEQYQYYQTIHLLLRMLLNVHRNIRTG